MNENMKRNHKDIEWKQLFFEIPVFFYSPWAYQGLYYTLYLTVLNLMYHLACSTPTIVSGVRIETISFVVI